MYYLTLNFTLKRPEDNIYKHINIFLKDKGFKRTSTNTNYKSGVYSIDHMLEYFFPTDSDNHNEKDLFKAHIDFERQAFDKFMISKGVGYEVEIYAVPELE